MFSKFPSIISNQGLILHLWLIVGVNTCSNTHNSRMAFYSHIGTPPSSITRFSITLFTLSTSALFSTRIALQSKKLNAQTFSLVSVDDLNSLSLTRSSSKSLCARSTRWNVPSHVAATSNAWWMGAQLFIQFNASGHHPWRNSQDKESV